MNPAALYCWTHTQQSQSPTVLLLLKPQPSVLNPTKFDNSSTSYMLRICVCTSPLSVLNGETNRKKCFNLTDLKFSPVFLPSLLQSHFITAQNKTRRQLVLYFPHNTTYFFLFISCFCCFPACRSLLLPLLQFTFFFIPNGQVLFSSSDSRFYSNKTLCKCWVVSCNSGESRLFARLVTV